MCLLFHAWIIWGSKMTTTLPAPLLTGWGESSAVCGEGRLVCRPCGAAGNPPRVCGGPGCGSGCGCSSRIPFRLPVSVAPLITPLVGGYPMTMAGNPVHITFKAFEYQQIKNMKKGFSYCTLCSRFMRCIRGGTSSMRCSMRCGTFGGASPRMGHPTWRKGPLPISS